MASDYPQTANKSNTDANKENQQIVLASKQQLVAELTKPLPIPAPPLPPLPPPPPPFLLDNSQDTSASSSISTLNSHNINNIKADTNETNVKLLEYNANAVDNCDHRINQAAKDNDRPGYRYSSSSIDHKSLNLTDSKQQLQKKQQSTTFCFPNPNPHQHVRRAISYSNTSQQRLDDFVHNHHNRLSSHLRHSNLRHYNVHQYLQYPPPQPPRPPSITIPLKIPDSVQKAINQTRAERDIANEQLKDDRQQQKNTDIRSDNNSAQYSDSYNRFEQCQPRVAANTNQLNNCCLNNNNDSMDGIQMIVDECDNSAMSQQQSSFDYHRVAKELNRKSDVLSSNAKTMNRVETQDIDLDKLEIPMNRHPSRRYQSRQGEGASTDYREAAHSIDTVGPDYQKNNNRGHQQDQVTVNLSHGYNSSYHDAVEGSKELNDPHHIQAPQEFSQEQRHHQERAYVAYPHDIISCKFPFEP